MTVRQLSGYNLVNYLSFLNSWYMATIKKDSIVFSTGRQITVPNGVLSISRKLELADYYSRNVLFYGADVSGEKKAEKVVNIYSLTKEELIEIADSMIHLWIDLKDNVRSLGVDNPEIFNFRKSEK